MRKNTKFHLTPHECRRTFVIAGDKRASASHESASLSIQRSGRRVVSNSSRTSKQRNDDDMVVNARGALYSTLVSTIQRYQQCSNLFLQRKATFHSILFWNAPFETLFTKERNSATDASVQDDDGIKVDSLYTC